MRVAPATRHSADCRGNASTRGEIVMMTGYGLGWGMGFGWLWMIVILVVVVLAIAALLKYLQK